MLGVNWGTIKRTTDWGCSRYGAVLSCRYTAPGEADRPNCPGQKTSRARPPVTNARMGRRRRELPKQGRAPRNRSKAG